MSDAAESDITAGQIAAAVAESTRTGMPISHAVARAIAERYMPKGRAPQGRAVYRKALSKFIATGAMESVNTTPPRWQPHPGANLVPPQALFSAVAEEGQWNTGSDADRDAMAAFGDYLTSRAMAEDLGPVQDWRSLDA